LQISFASTPSSFRGKTMAFDSNCDCDIVQDNRAEQAEQSTNSSRAEETTVHRAKQ
jgi:hypothetical protein